MKKLTLIFASSMPNINYQDSINFLRKITFRRFINGHQGFSQFLPYQMDAKAYAMGPCHFLFRLNLLPHAISDVLNVQVD
jgi:hypothetical protein